jgi:hypothetical protein
VVDIEFKGKLNQGQSDIHIDENLKLLENMDK